MTIYQPSDHGFQWGDQLAEPKRSKSTMKTYSVRENGVWSILIKAPSIEQAMAGAIEMAEPAHFDSHDYEAGTIIEVEVANVDDEDDSLQRTITIEAPKPTKNHYAEAVGCDQGEKCQCRPAAAWEPYELPTAFAAIIPGGTPMHLWCDGCELDMD